jgi:protein-tyrosine phosphatase
MEKRHKDIVKKNFHIDDQMLIVLDIEDDYQFADEELIIILRTALADYLG